MRALAPLTLVVALVACEHGPDGSHVVAESPLQLVRRLAPTAVVVGSPRGLVATLPRHGRDALRLVLPAAAGSFLRVDTALAEKPCEVHEGVSTLVEAKPATDVLWVNTPDGVEELRVLRAGADGFASYELTVGPDIDDARVTGDRVELLAGGRVALQTAPIFAVDSAGTHRTPVVTVRREAAQRYRMDVTLALEALRFPVILDPKWTTVAPMSSSRAEGKAVLLPSGVVLVADGTASPGTLVDEYDAKANKWTSYLLLKPRTYSTMTLLDSGKVLLAGGGGQSNAEVYDPTLHTSTATANDMSVGRSMAGAAKLASGKVLVAGGVDPGVAGQPPLSSADLFDPTTAKFSAVASLPVARGYVAAVALPTGKVLVAGGSNAAGAPLAEVDLYEPLTNTWTAAASLLTPRSAAKIALVGGKVYIGGGYVTGGVGDDVIEAYDPTLDKWTKVGTFKTKRIGAGYGFTSSKLFLVTGQVSTPTGWLASASVESMDLATGAVVDEPSVAAARMNPGVSPLADGRIFVFGGTTGAFPETLLAEILDPAKSCTSSSECLPTEGCSAEGLCKPKAADGVACPSDAFCKSSHCVDGVCCDKPCTGSCEACTTTLKGSGADGVCGNVAVDTDPRSKCALDPGFPVSCKADGLCDGAGACRAFAKASTACGATTCVDGKVSGQLCNGAGVCAPATAASCGAYRCDATGTACRTKCATEADCAVDHACVGEACTPKAGSKADGQPCTDPVACKSGLCVDGVCCNVACNGVCQACDLKGKEGTCAVLAGAPRAGHPSCGDGVCAGTCDGIEALKCSYPKDGALCGVAGRCAKGVCTEADAGPVDGGADAVGDAAEAATPAAEGGCGCEVGRRTETGSLSFGLLLAGAVALRRRRG